MIIVQLSDDCKKYDAIRFKIEVNVAYYFLQLNTRKFYHFILFCVFSISFHFSKDLFSMNIDFESLTLVYSSEICISLGIKMQ